MTEPRWRRRAALSLHFPRKSLLPDMRKGTRPSITPNHGTCPKNVAFLEDVRSASVSGRCETRPYLADRSKPVQKLVSAFPLSISPPVLPPNLVYFISIIYNQSERDSQRKLTPCPT